MYARFSAAMKQIITLHNAHTILCYLLVHPVLFGGPSSHGARPIIIIVGRVLRRAIGGAKMRFLVGL